MCMYKCLNLSVANITIKIIIQCGRAKHMNLDFEFLEKTIKRKKSINFEPKTRETLEITHIIYFGRLNPMHLF